MKIRNGFVSNSSSSSFMIYGASIECSKIAELLNITLNGCGDDGENDYDILDKAVGDAVKDTGLEFHIPYEWDDVFLGISWNKVGDDETGKEFKLRVEAAIEKAVGKKVKCSTHLETYSSY